MFLGATKDPPTRRALVGPARPRRIGTAVSAGSHFPALTTGCVPRSEQSTTSRLLTIVGLLGVVQLDDLLTGEPLQGHLDHADRPLDDLLPRRDHGAGLLALEHGVGDLGRVGQVADPGLQDLDPRLLEPVLDLGLEVLGDLGRVAPQRDLPLGVRVIRVAQRHVPQGGLALDVDEVVVIVDVEERLGRVDHLPDDDGGDLDRVARQVVDLEALALEVPDPERDGPLGEERVDPAEPRFADRAVVVAEELEDLRLVRIDGEEPEQAGDATDPDQRRQEDQRRTLLADPGDHDQPAEHQPAEQAGQHPHARLRGDEDFLHDVGGLGRGARELVHRRDP